MNKINLYIEDLVVLRFLKTEQETATWDEIEQFGHFAIDKIRAKDFHGQLHLSRDKTTAFLNKYSQFFEEAPDGCTVIAPRDTIIEEFVGYLPSILLTI